MQVQFTEQEVAALRRSAAERNVSISAVVRDAVDRCVVGDRDREAAIARAMDVIGRFRSNSGDTSLRHDDYFVDAAEG